LDRDNVRKFEYYVEEGLNNTFVANYRAITRLVKHLSPNTASMLYNAATIH